MKLLRNFLIKHLPFILAIPLLGAEGPFPKERTARIQNESSGQNDQTILLQIKQKNGEKLAAIRALNLPLGQYAIISSGPLGIRNLREIGDIDIIVLPELWDALAAKYSVTDMDGVKKIVFPGNIVEAFREGSFYTKPKYPDAPTEEERIAQAEVIEGLPFETLEHVLYFKGKMGREKDLKDIAIIETYLKTQSGAYLIR